MCLSYRRPWTSAEFLMHHFPLRKDSGLSERLWVICREQLRMAMNTLACSVSHTHTQIHSCMCACLHIHAWVCIDELFSRYDVKQFAFILIKHLKAIINTSAH